MKRLYTVEYYREMLARCRETVPGVAVSPATSSSASAARRRSRSRRRCDLVREARFKNSFIFKYSARPGTKADELYPDDVPEEVKKRRNNDLLAIQNAISLADHRPLDRPRRSRCWSRGRARTPGEPASGRRRARCS